MTESNQRATQRVPFADEVRFRAPQPYVAQGVDIGAGGIGVILPELLDIDTQVEIEIFDGAATAYGTVRWTVKDGDAYRIGIQFREEDWVIMELVESLRSQEG